MIKNIKTIRFRVTFLIISFCFIGQLLSACSTSRPAITKYRTNFNFSQVSSYAFYDRNSDFSNFQNISDATRNSIELAIEQVLDKKGFVYKIENNADIIVTYHLITKNSKELAKYNQGVNYCSYCLRSGEAQKSKEKFRVMPGSLIIDVLNPDNVNSVWRSVYDLEINFEKDNSKEIQLNIYSAIEAMIEKYPYQHIIK